MGLNSHIGCIVGKTISHVIKSEKGTIGKQVFLVFDDNTSIELYGDIQNSKGLRIGTFEDTLQYARCFNNVVIECFGPLTSESATAKQPSKSTESDKSHQEGVNN